MCRHVDLTENLLSTVISRVAEMRKSEPKTVRATSAATNPPRPGVLFSWEEVWLSNVTAVFLVLQFYGIGLLVVFMLGRVGDQVPSLYIAQIIGTVLILAAGWYC